MVGAHLVAGANMLAPGSGVGERAVTSVLALSKLLPPETHPVVRFGSVVGVVVLATESTGIRN